MNQQSITDYPHKAKPTPEKSLSDTTQTYNEQNTSERRARRIQEMKKRKARQMQLRKIAKIALPLLILLIVITVIVVVIPDSSADQNVPGSTNGQGGTALQGNGNGLDNTLGQGTAEGQDNNNGHNSTALHDNDNEETNNRLSNSGGQNNTGESDSNTDSSEPPQNTATYSANITDNTLQLSSEIVSTNALFIDLETDNILGQKAMNTVISPASMTKVLTILVAAEQIEASQLDDTFTMTLEITDYGYINDCSSAGFLDGEEITVRDLFYGTILPSGADAAVGLAVYTAGSHEAFVELMNEKIEDLGLSDTAHMTNCVGIYNANHHCSVYDMAMIMEAAIENDICREVMTAHTYTTSATPQHPEGILLSNWFLRRIEDKDTGGEVICAKTGYVAQSGSCAVSYGTDNAGKEYVCVTANSTSSWKCIYDHVALYKKFATGD